MPSFQYIQPTEEQKNKMQHYRERFQTLVNDILKEEESTLSDRSMNKSIEKLEEAAFWLNKSITHNDF